VSNALALAYRRRFAGDVASVFDEVLERRAAW